MRFLAGLSVALASVGASLASVSNGNTAFASVEPTQSLSHSHSHPHSKSHSGSKPKGGVSRVNLYLPENWEPEGVQASVVAVEPTATTFLLGCAATTSDCVLPVSTVTQGPSMWACEGKWTSVGDMDSYTLVNDCEIGSDKDMTCTQAVTQVVDGKTSSTSMTIGTTWNTGLVYPISVTAGAKKLARPVPTTDLSAAEVTLITVSKTIVHQPKPTVESSVPEPLSQTEETATTSTEPPPAPTAAAAAPGVVGNPVVVGMLAAMGGALML